MSRGDSAPDPAFSRDWLTEKASRQQAAQPKGEARGPGMMLQLDASFQDWLEGRGPRLTLVGAGSPQAKGRIERLGELFKTVWSVSCA